MNKEIISLSANEIAFKIKSQEISVTQTVNAFLKRIEQINPLVNAISDIRKKEDILNEAKKKDLHIEKGKELGILFGVPITIKE
ncbi:MAG: amidase, partial [Sulfurimonas sp.]